MLRVDDLSSATSGFRAWDCRAFFLGFGFKVYDIP